MFSFSQLKGQVEATGLKGKEVECYVMQQQTYKRDERLMKRNKKRKRGLKSLNESEKQRRLESAKLEEEKEIELARISASAKSSSHISGDPRIFIKERGVFSLETAAELADNWVSARNAYPRTSSSHDKKTGRKEHATSEAISRTSKGPSSTVRWVS
ncbi:hypothetical protein Pcinc_014120 [Petrolisthes cinctipes]|uniref:Uncharacterized protein n=1 Tax=Petrolisthes cinctipes TaxID=88211 RepID=A0AAE1FX62_PETCI|nr:hypothetical protein Pcinc_014120 [Petrolisthes cinctipes]